MENAIKQYMVCDHKIMLAHAESPEEALSKIDRRCIEEIFGNARELEGKYKNLTGTPIINVFEIS